MSWHAPAPVIETRIFSVLPAEFRRARKTAWFEANKGGAAVDCFLEGPCFGTSGPDGLAITEDDSLCVAHATLGAVFVFAASGEPRWRIASCAGKTTTNLAFGGKTRSTLYITESSTGSILVAAVPVPGKALPLV